VIRKKWLRGIICGFIAFLFSFSLSFLSFFRILEWKTWDWRTKFLTQPEKASPDLVLVLIDQASLDFYAPQGITWPWPRQMYAAFLDFLTQGGAKAVIIDLILSEPSSYGVEDDLLLAEAIRRNGHTFLSAGFSLNPPVSDEPPDPILKKFSLKEIKNRKAAVIETRSAILPLREFLEGARGLGNVLFSPDADAIFRRLPLYCRFEGMIFPSLPLAVAQDIREEKLWINRLDREGKLVLHFFGPAGTYKSYSLASLINSWVQIQHGQQPQVKPDEFRNKIVFLATSAPGLLDLRPTPVSSVTPGVEIQATALDNLLQGRAIGFPPRALSLVVFLFFGLISGLIVSLLVKIIWQSLGLIIILAGPWIAGTLAFRQGFWLEIVPAEMAALTSFILAALLNYSLEGRERRFIKNVFRHYLSPEIIDRIIANPALLRLGGEEREITSFFSDIAGFSSLAEKLSPADLVKWLNEYLSVMTDIILEEGGTLDKYEGDAIIAFWNAPLDQPDHALRACRAAVRCQQELVRLNPEWQSRFGQPVRMRIGINSGLAVVGNMGSKRRFDYTAMGDTVNLASRLEGAGKFYGVSILISEFTFEQAEAELVVRPVDVVRVVGKTQPVKIYELLGLKSGFPPEKLDWLKIFNQAWQAYRERDFAQALTLFASLPEEGLTRFYVRRCQEFLTSPPPPDWDGVFNLKEK